MQHQNDKKAKKHNLIDFPVQSETPEAAKQPEQKTAARSLKYLWGYALGIFSVAVVLVLLSFLSQQRAQQQHIDFSNSALKSIETMRKENEQLLTENAELVLSKNTLSAQIALIQQQMDVLLNSNDQLRGELEQLDAQLAQRTAEYNDIKSQLELMQAEAENPEGE